MLKLFSVKYNTNVVYLWDLQFCEVSSTEHKLIGSVFCANKYMALFYWEDDECRGFFYLFVCLFGGGVAPGKLWKAMGTAPIENAKAKQL